MRSDLANLVCRSQHNEHHTAKYLDIHRQQEINACLLSPKDTSITHTHVRTNTLIRSGRVLESWSLLVANISPTASDRTEPVTPC